MAPTVFQSRVVTKEELCVFEQKVDSCAVVIFGASGDLTHRKLLPALYALALHKQMPRSYYVVGVARTPMTDEAFRAKVRESVGSGSKSDVLNDFLDHCHYISGDYADAQTFQKLKDALASLDERYGINNRRVF